MPRVSQPSGTAELQLGIARNCNIAGVLGNLLRGRGVAFFSSDSLARALQAYVAGRGDFADYLIREHARAAGADTVATFDCALFNEGGFSKL